MKKKNRTSNARSGNGNIPNSAVALHEVTCTEESQEESKDDLNQSDIVTPQNASGHGLNSSEVFEQAIDSEMAQP